MRLKVFSFALTFMLIGFYRTAAAQMEVPEEELARESVLPRFERGEAVKNRSVVTEKKLELGVYGGWNFTEPIYNQAKLGFNAGYHFSEANAFIMSKLALDNTILPSPSLL
jgi:hypothetical protein